MTNGRWDLPLTEQGMAILLERLRESRAAGNDTEVGWGLLSLARMVMWVRSDNEEPMGVRPVSLVNEAIEIFRRTGDDRGLLRALLHTNPFLGPEKIRKRLDEAQSIADRVGDRHERARVKMARARAAGDDSSRSVILCREAVSEFRALSDRHQLASGLFSLAILEDDPHEKHRSAVEAADLFRDLGDWKQVSKSLQLALLYGEEVLPLEALEPLMRQGLSLADKDPFGKGLFHGYLAKLAAKRGQTEDAMEHRRHQTSGERGDSMSPREWQAADLWATRQLLTLAKESGNEEAVVTFQNELRRLRKRSPDESLH